MIVPMKKVSLVVLEKERRQALKVLRKLGVLHIEEVQGSGDKLADLKEQTSVIENAISVLSEIKVNKKTLTEKKCTKEEALDIAEKIIAFVAEKKSCVEQIASDTKEIDRLAKWGDFDPDDFKFLSEKGVHLYLFEIPSDKYKYIGDSVQTLLVNSDKSITRMLVLSDSVLVQGERPEGLGAEAYPVLMPRCVISDLRKSVEANQSRILQIDNILKENTSYCSALSSALQLFYKDIELENLCSGMGCESRPDISLSKSATEENVADEKKSFAPLAWLTGFVPVEDLPSVLSSAKEQSWAVVASDPGEEDNVPTKLKNNKLVSLIYPVTDFLGTVPGYNEYDISNWFLLFFVVFFGMIFGDGGYGTLLFLAGLGLIFSSVSKKRNPSPFVLLLTLLGFATMVWGCVTCTWFGLTPEQLPEIIKKFSVPCLSNAVGSAEATKGNMSPVSFLTNESWVKENLQIFCFTLALIQLSVAHLKGIAKYRKSLKCLGEFGSLLQLWGMFYVVLSMVVDGQRFPLGETSETFYLFQTIPLPYLCIALIVVGFVLGFVFSNYEGSIGKSILESLKGIVSVLLGVVNVFSDIVSYIRLWAVALAGSAISATVNSMAGPMFGKAILFFAAILLLVVGHGLNMTLNVLSVIVHGVRLNTLEFSTHLGMSWTGFKYNPFKEL